MAAPARGGSSDWLYGPIPDLFLGCGLLFVVVSVLFGLAGPAFFASVPLVIPALLIALVSAPHYGATIVRVYQHRADRRAYFLFSVVATLALLGVAGLAFARPWLGSVLATVYLSWSSWHYSGQNYGISVMFLRRRGVALDRGVQRILQSSFVLSFVLVVLVIHGAGSPIADPSVEVRLIPLAIPQGVNDLLLPVCLFAYVATTVAWIVLLARGAQRITDLGPTLLVALVQALWWSVPYLGKHYGLPSEWVALEWDDRLLFFPWIACAHAAQYLWITSFYARSSGRWNGQARYYVTVLAAGSAVWALPALLFAPGAGAFDWNFALLLSATVNIHHFILDGAIWKLRHMKIARILIASGPVQEDSGEGRTGLRKVVWMIAGLGLLMSLHGLAERFVIEPSARERGDLEAVADSLDRQAWLGKGSAFERFKLGRAFERAGNSAAAVEQLELSAGMEPRVESIKRLIDYYYRGRDRVGFVRSCERLFDLDQVDRPLPRIDAEVAPRPQYVRYREACLDVAEATRPVSSKTGDASGGSGVDGGVPRRGGY